METAFGSLLKDWRGRRNVSQLTLGLDANVSARHISFLESGRARPSRSMVLHLCDSLDVPRESRNTLLNAAGFASAYRRRDLDEDDMAQVRAAMDWTLERHNPFPAFAFDRHWTLVKLNNTATLLFSGMNLAVGDSLLEAATDTEKMAKYLENWPEIAEHTVARLRTESAHLGGDPVLDAAADKLAQANGTSRRSTEHVLPAIVPAVYRANGMRFSFFSTIAQFGGAEDIALSELKIELMFPADDATRQVLMSMENS